MGALGAILVALGIVGVIFGLIKKSQAKRMAWQRRRKRQGNCFAKARQRHATKT